MKEINFLRVNDDLGDIEKIERIDKNLALLRNFKSGNRFSSKVINNEIAYLEQAQLQLFNGLIGTQEDWDC